MDSKKPAGDRLRVAPPEVSVDPVFVERLAALASASAPSPAAGRSVARIAAAAVGVVVVTAGAALGAGAVIDGQDAPDRHRPGPATTTDDQGPGEHGRGDRPDASPRGEPRDGHTPTDPQGDDRGHLGDPGHQADENAQEPEDSGHQGDENAQEPEDAGHQGDENAQQPEEGADRGGEHGPDEDSD